MFVNQKGIRFFPENEAEKVSTSLASFAHKNSMLMLEEANRKLMDELKGLKKENMYLKDKVRVLQELFVMKDTRRGSIKPEFSTTDESSIDFESHINLPTPLQQIPLSTTEESRIPSPPTSQTKSHFFLNFVIIVVSLWTRRKLFCAERDCENLERRMEQMKNATVSLVDEFTKQFKEWGGEWKQTNRVTNKKVDDLVRLLRECKRHERSISQKSNALFTMEESLDTQFSIE